MHESVRDADCKPGFVYCGNNKILHLDNRKYFRVHFNNNIIGKLINIYLNRQPITELTATTRSLLEYMFRYV